MLVLYFFYKKSLCCKESINNTRWILTIAKSFFNKIIHLHLLYLVDATFTHCQNSFVTIHNCQLCNIPVKKSSCNFTIVTTISIILFFCFFLFFCFKRLLLISYKMDYTCQIDLWLKFLQGLFSVWFFLWCLRWKF